MSGRSKSTWVDPIGVAMVQTRLEMGDLEGNLSRAREMIRASADEERPDLVVLPEAFSTGFDYNRLPEIAERAPSVVRELGEIAGELHIWMMFTQVVKEGSSYFNRAVVLDDDGSVVCTYDKTHLFSRAGEDAFLTAGSSHAAFDIKGAKVSPLICYEVRYPEMARALH